MDQFVECSHNRPGSSSLLPVEDTVAAAGKMVHSLGKEGGTLFPSLTVSAAPDPASPAGIAQTVVVLLTPTLAATVDTAVQRGLEQLHLEFQAQAQRLTHAEERISSLEDEAAANSAVLTRISNSHRDLWDKLDDLENHLWRNNLHNLRLLESFAQLTDFCAKNNPEQLGFCFPCTVKHGHHIGQSANHRTKPLPIIVQYLNYANKKAILQKFCGSRALSILMSQTCCFLPIAW